MAAPAAVHFWELPEKGVLMVFRVGVTLAVLVALMAVGPVALADPENGEPDVDAVEPENGEPEWVVTPTGLKYADIKVGEGAEARAGRTVQVHYVGRLEDGTVFDSSRARNALFSFRLGEGRVIKGWEEGINGMKVGGQRTLIIPPHLAYGRQGAGGVIPPDATLTFEVELFGVR